MAKHSLREQILSAGFDVLYARGFNATSVQDIAEAAGAPKGSFYNHFESKEALGEAVVREYVTRIGAIGAVLGDDSLAPLDRLRRYFGTLAHIGDQDGSRGCLLGNFGSELANQSEVIRASVREGFEAWRGALAQVIGQAQRRGDISADHAPEDLAGVLIDAWEGAVLRAKVDGGRAPVRAFLDVALLKLLS